MMQDSENDELEIGTTEITQLLGDKENLYQKILYLVIADSAYSEGEICPHLTRNLLFFVCFLILGGSLVHGSRSS